MCIHYLLLLITYYIRDDASRSRILVSHMASVGDEEKKKSNNNDNDNKKKNQNQKQKQKLKLKLKKYNKK